MKRGRKVLLTLIAVIVGLAGILYFYSQYRFRQAEVQYPPEGEFVTVDGVKLHYIHEGEGRPVVMLHGGVLYGKDFAESVKMLAAEGYQAISFDRPGYGYSERPRDTKVTPMDQAKLIHDALKQMGVEKPILVGHSWSGVLVMSYALQYPNDISGIVTLGAGMYKEGYPAENGDPISNLVLTPVIGPAFMNTVLGSPLGTALGNSIMKATFAPEPVPEDYRKEALALWRRPKHFRANREDVVAFVPAVEKISHRYSEIQIPTVIVVGKKDPFPTKEHSYRAHEDLPNSTLVELPDAAHMIPQHHPEEVVKAVQKLE